MKGIWSLRLFSLLILLLPVQLAYHFWPDWSLVWGIRIDYLAPAIYLTDILVVLVLIFGFFEKRVKIRFPSVCLLPLLLFVALNIFQALVWQVALVAWFKIGETVLLGYYVFQNWKDTKQRIVSPLFVSLVCLLAIAIGQLFFQSTLGGPLWLLGERSFNVSTPGIALANIWGRNILRPYAIFSHPNSLAGYALLATGIFLAAKKWWGVVVGSLIVGLSFSQVAWLALGAMFFLFLIRTRLTKFNLRKVAVIFLVSVLYFSLVSPYVFARIVSREGVFPEGIAQRLELAVLAGFSFARSPLFGVGLGNFVVQIPNLHGEVFVSLGKFVSWWIQPVHNIFLLTLAQTGILGWGILAWVFAQSVKQLKNNSILFLALLTILLTGSFDHYWLTLQQNLLLLGIFFGMIFAWDK